MNHHSGGCWNGERADACGVRMIRGEREFVVQFLVRELMD